MDAIIFDFDGVIVDSEKYWRREEKKFFKSVIPGWKETDHHKIVGMTMAGSYELFRKDYEMDISLEEYLEEYKDIARRVYEQCSLIEGMTVLLGKLQKATIPLAVASSAPGEWVRHILKNQGIFGYFRAIVTAEDIGEYEGKPKPAIYLLTAKKLGVKPETCIAIEDATNGILAAKTAGMKCIGVDFPGNTPQNLSRADLVITDFNELSIEQLNSLI
ncbi:MAG TPA: HAD family phosphatase [Candidatus Peribacteraceae bacterium]|nr:HAD family phosphatase [Candidatus Peribacteraceae bacterium]